MRTGIVRPPFEGFGSFPEGVRSWEYCAFLLLGVVVLFTEVKLVLVVLSLALVNVVSLRGSGVGYIRGGSGARNDPPMILGLSISARSSTVSSFC